MANRGVSSNILCADPDEMVHYHPSHMDLHCLQRYQANLKL